MHEAAFSQAARPAPVRVLGLNLRPYSLGHELCLIREHSALASGMWNPKFITRAMIDGLPLAALICSQTWDQINAMNHDWFIGLKLWLWKRRLKKMRKRKEDNHLAAFLEYQSRACVDIPGEPPTSTKPSRPLGTPELLRLHHFLRVHLRKTDSQAWDHPYGLAKMYYGAHLELEGQWNVRGPYEEEYDKARDEWMAANPGNTLNPQPDA